MCWRRSWRITKTFTFPAGAAIWLLESFFSIFLDWFAVLSCFFQQFFIRFQWFSSDFQWFCWLCWFLIVVLLIFKCIPSVFQWFYGLFNDFFRFARCSIDLGWFFCDVQILPLDYQWLFNDLSIEVPLNLQMISLPFHWCSGVF